MMAEMERKYNNTEELHCLHSKIIKMYKKKGVLIMAMSATDNHKSFFETEDLNIRDKVIAGLMNIQTNNTKDFNDVCDRLEKKYTNAAIHN